MAPGLCATRRALRSGSATPRDRYRLAAIDEFLGTARDLDAGSSQGEGFEVGLAVTALGSLTAKQRTLVERQLSVLSPLLDSRSADAAGGGISPAASALGVSTRTVRRRLERLRFLGPAGLIDERLLKDTRRSVDPRWNEACSQVPKDYANGSTPSKRTVIRRANAAFLAIVPDGRLPSESVAYERVTELDHGMYTFGEAEQRRSVSERPQGVLGQLRPTRRERVRPDGWLQARCLRDGAGDDAVGEHLAVGRDGPLRPVAQGHSTAARCGQVGAHAERAGGRHVPRRGRSTWLGRAHPNPRMW